MHGLATQQPRRIYVTGFAGSGKSTLVRHIASRLQRPAFSFDAIAFDPATHQRRSDDDRKSDVMRIAALPGWVVDCWYLDWTRHLLEQADFIIWLDLPWRIALWRMVKRHALAELTHHNPHPGWWNLWRFVRSERSHYTALPSPQTDLQGEAFPINWINTQRVLACYGSKVQHCTTPSDVAVLARKLTNKQQLEGYKRHARFADLNF